MTRTRSTQAAAVGTTMCHRYGQGYWEIHQRWCDRIINKLIARSTEELGNQMEDPERDKIFVTRAFRTGRLMQRTSVSPLWWACFQNPFAWVG